MIKIKISGELTDLNTYIKALNSNRMVANKIKQDETDRVAWEARLTRAKPVEKYPVKITYKWFSKDERKDIDNVAFSKKFINDGLVRAGILEDDSRKYIASFSDGFYVDKEDPRVEVYIESGVAGALSADKN